MDHSTSTRLDMENIAQSPQPRSVLVLGATGYIGGRLVPRLLQAGHRVRVAVRSPQKVESVPWSDQVEVHQLDLDEESDGVNYEVPEFDCNIIEAPDIFEECD